MNAMIMAFLTDVGHQQVRMARAGFLPFSLRSCD
jgi:hypothetical protein